MLPVHIFQPHGAGTNREDNVFAADARAGNCAAGNVERMTSQIVNGISAVAAGVLYRSIFNVVSEENGIIAGSAVNRDIVGVGGNVVVALAAAD